MAKNLLYFPYIDIPNSNWTIKSILYWDNVGIIVPPDYSERPEQYHKFTIDLLKRDLVNQVYPSSYIWDIKDFDQIFLKLVLQQKFNLAKHQNDFHRGLESRIHFQKFGETLMHDLVQMHLARRHNWEWYFVENKTARLLMLYLATIIGKVGDFTPATDNIRNLDTTLSQRGTSFKLSLIRQKLIDDLIPYPIAPNLTKLRKFKDKYHEELSSFRILIENKSFDISSIRGGRKQDEKEKLVLEEINDKRSKILSDLNQSKIGQITFGTICGIAGAVIGFATENNPLAIFSLSNAVFSALQGYNKKPILNSDYSYLALIDKKLK